MNCEYDDHCLDQWVSNSKGKLKMPGAKAYQRHKSVSKAGYKDATEGGWKLSYLCIAEMLFIYAWPWWSRWSEVEKWGGVISSHENSSELDSILTMISWNQKLPYTWTNAGHLWPMLRGWILCWTARGSPCGLEMRIVCSLNVLWELGQQTINSCQNCQRLIWPLCHCICWHRLEDII